MSYHGANFPRRLTWEWTKNRYHYCLPLRLKNHFREISETDKFRFENKEVKPVLSSLINMGTEEKNGITHASPQILTVISHKHLIYYFCNAGIQYAIMTPCISKKLPLTASIISRSTFKFFFLINYQKYSLNMQRRKFIFINRFQRRKI